LVWFGPAGAGFGRAGAGGSGGFSGGDAGDGAGEFGLEVGVDFLCDALLDGLEVEHLADTDDLDRFDGEAGFAFADEDGAAFVADEAAGDHFAALAADDVVAELVLGAGFGAAAAFG